MGKITLLILQHVSFPILRLNEISSPVRRFLTYNYFWRLPSHSLVRRHVKSNSIIIPSTVFSSSQNHQSAVFARPKIHANSSSALLFSISWTISTSSECAFAQFTFCYCNCIASKTISMVGHALDLLTWFCAETWTIVPGWFYHLHRSCISVFSSCFQWFHYNLLFCLSHIVILRWSVQYGVRVIKKEKRKKDLVWYAIASPSYRIKEVELLKAPTN